MPPSRRACTYASYTLRATGRFLHTCIFSIHVLSLRPPFLSPLYGGGRNSDPRSQSRRFSPLPTTVPGARLASLSREKYASSFPRRQTRFELYRSLVHRITKNFGTCRPTLPREAPHSVCMYGTLVTLQNTTFFHLRYSINRLFVTRIPLEHQHKQTALNPLSIALPCVGTKHSNNK